MRERQEEQEKDCSSSKSSKSDWNEWNSEQASGKMLDEGPNHVTALKNGIMSQLKQLGLIDFLT